MGEKIADLRNYIRQKGTSVALFAYGIIVGTSSPLLFSHCTSGGCSGCGGFCVVSLGILPLLLFIAVKSRAKGIAGQFASLWNRGSNR